MPHPMRWGHNVSMAIVCPSVWPMPDPKSRIEWCRNVKIGRKEAYDTGDLWPHLTIKWSRSLDHLIPWPKISHIFRTGRPTNFRLGKWMEYNDPHHQHAHWPPRWNLWVAVQVTTCRVWGILWRPNYRLQSLLTVLLKWTEDNANSIITVLWRKINFSRMIFCRFYCTFQQSDNPRWLTSGRVNDGICDCCDGSDEWQQIRLPPHIAVHGLLSSSFPE